MTVLAIASAFCVAAWAVLVVVAQLRNPDQSPLAMGMSGLARGRDPWVMKSAFVVRGLSALLLVAALPTVLGAGGAALAGLVLFWIWGGGSAALALADTDMPGETPSRAGAAHTWIALVAYVAGVAGAIVLSLALRGDEATAGVARWALPIALSAAVALAVQFVAFAAAARQAQDAAAGLQATGSHAVPGLGASAGPQPPAATPSLALSGVAPALEAPASAVAATRPASGLAGLASSSGLAAYAGLLQRVFLGLLMAWTLLVALGI